MSILRTLKAGGFQGSQTCAHKNFIVIKRLLNFDQEELIKQTGGWLLGYCAHVKVNSTIREGALFKFSGLTCFKKNYFG